MRDGFLVPQHIFTYVMLNGEELPPQAEHVRINGYEITSTFYFGDATLDITSKERVLRVWLYNHWFFCRGATGRLFAVSETRKEHPYPFDTEGQPV